RHPRRRPTAHGREVDRMNTSHVIETDELAAAIQPLLEQEDLPGIVALLTPASSEQLVSLVERLPLRRGAVVYRLLPKERALEVFERLAPGLQSDLSHGLQDSEVAAIFASLHPDDRVWLLDELPAGLAPR